MLSSVEAEIEVEACSPPSLVALVVTVVEKLFTAGGADSVKTTVTATSICRHMILLLLLLCTEEATAACSCTVVASAKVMAPFSLIMMLSANSFGITTAVHWTLWLLVELCGSALVPT